MTNSAKIIIIAKELDFSGIDKILRILTPNVKVDFVDEENIEKIENIAEDLQKEDFIIFNYDRPFLKSAVRGSYAKKITFGFSEGSDFLASDENITDSSTNFKLNYKGNIIPIWLSGQGKEKIYFALPAICVGDILGLNAVEMSESLKNI